MTGEAGVAPMSASFPVARETESSDTHPAGYPGNKYLYKTMRRGSPPLVGNLSLMMWQPEMSSDIVRCP